MNKYKFKILPEEGKFKGYATLNDEVVYTTRIHNDAITASRDLAQYAVTQQGKSTLQLKAKSFTIKKSEKPSAPQTVNTPAFARRCCGRG